MANIRHTMSIVLVTLGSIIVIGSIVINSPVVGVFDMRDTPLSPVAIYPKEYFYDQVASLTFPNKFYVELSTPSSNLVVSYPPLYDVVSFDSYIQWQYHETYAYETMLTYDEYYQVLASPDCLGIWLVPAVIPYDLHPTIAPYLDMQTALDTTGVSALHSDGHNGQNTVIVLYDGFPPASTFYSYIPSSWASRIIRYPAETNPIEEHGIMTTSVAGQVAPEAELYLISFTETDILNAFDMTQKLLTTYPVVISSNSYGFSPGYVLDDSNHIINRCISAVAEKGAIICFGAGNWAHPGEHNPEYMYDGGYDARNVDFSRNNEIGYPSSLNNVICVAACTADEEQILSYSSLGTGIDDHMKPDVAAPTHFSCSYSPIYGGGSYGTSGATPFMAGILSCVLSTYEPDIKNIITHVIDSSIDRGSNGFDVEFGYGCVDALKLFDNYPNWWSSLRVDVLSGIVIICIGLIAIPRDEEEEKIPQYH